jgi:penicillin-binding protein-related factor A (putative recombinase)
MSETKESANFIETQKEIYGRVLYISKQFMPLKVGEPDIVACYKGMPCYIESKKINEISFINNHPFTDIQIHNLRIKKQAGAMAIGLLILNKNNIRFLDVSDLKNHITKEDWLKAEKFNWETLRLKWIKEIQNFS